MYYGYELMWTLTFVPVGFLIVMAASIGYCLVYVVGAARGSVAAARYLKACTISLLLASLADVVYALASGDAQTFLAWYGVWPLLEMAVLGVMCVGSLWFMAAAYVRGKSREAAAGAQKPSTEHGSVSDSDDLAREV